MNPHIADEVSKGIGWSAFTTVGNMKPPRDPEREEDEGEENEEEDRADEPAVVREPDED
jgi:hypothetical protein